MLSRLLPGRVTGVRYLCAVMLLLLTTAAWAGIQRVQIDQAYLAAGTSARGTVSLALEPEAPKDARLRVVLIRNIDVADKAKSPVGQFTTEVVNQVVGGKTGTLEVAFSVTTKGMLFGTIQAKAELLTGKEARVLATALSAPVQVGLRKRVSLAGEWKVADVKVFDGEFPGRPKDWKLGQFPTSVQLPGALTSDRAFRGWVTLKREISWAKDGALQPRALGIWGASDSALISINGTKIGETNPVENLAMLTSWFEFHNPFKGPENEQKRMLTGAGGSEYPFTMPLPQALPAAGKAEVEMVLRATSGGVMGAPLATYGVLNDLHLELAPAVNIEGVEFDTEKPGEKRRFKFLLTVSNETGKPYKGKIRAAYGRYQGDLPYTGACPAYATVDQAVTLPVGKSKVAVVREEMPRFDTCRATFLLLGAKDAVMDAMTQDFHTVTVEIRNRRDLYVNNERFIIKGQGSWGEDPNSRMQLRMKGGNAFRGHRSAPSRLVPTYVSEVQNIDERYRDGLLTSAGSALLASCEKCTFYNPKDTSNIDKAVKSIIDKLNRCPGIIIWEATNELHGEPEEARIAIQEAFHKYDPYHRPISCTKSSGEWEAEARDGRVAGTDIVGCQYLLTKEGVDSITAAITEQPIESTEVNWNDPTLYNEQKMYDVWLNKGLIGSLFFDYSGNSLDQPVPMTAPADGDPNAPGYLIRESQRLIYQDLVVKAEKQADGRILLTAGNQMPYMLRDVKLTVQSCGQFTIADLNPGEAASILLPLVNSPAVRERVAIRAEYTTHSGLKHLVVLTPMVVNAPAAKGVTK